MTEYNLFGTAVHNTPELTTFVADINLNLQLVGSIEKESTKLDVISLVDDAAKGNNYKLSKKATNSMSSKSSVDSIQLSIRISNINNVDNLDEFVGLFTKFGSIKRSNILLPKCFGFITYFEHANAVAAVKEMNRFRYNHSILEVGLAK